MDGCHTSSLLLLQVGPGVKELCEGDVVLPTPPLLGTFAQAAVVKAKEVVRVGRVAAPSAAPAQGEHMHTQYIHRARQCTLGVYRQFNCGTDANSN